MKRLLPFLLEFTLAVPGVFAQAAAGTPVPLPEAPAPGAPEARPRRVPVDPAVDAFYKLGRDSMPMDGVPKGKFTEAKVLPSQVFPGITRGASTVTGRNKAVPFSLN